MTNTSKNGYINENKPIHGMAYKRKRANFILIILIAAGVILFNTNNQYFQYAAVILFFLAFLIVFAPMIY